MTRIKNLWRNKRECGSKKPGKLNENKGASHTKYGEGGLTRKKDDQNKSLCVERYDGI